MKRTCTMKKEKRSNNIRKNAYDFDLKEEEKIYKYVCGRMTNREKKKMSENNKFTSYGCWKKYIVDKYEDYSYERLVDFSHFLNQKIRNIKLEDDYWIILIPVTLAIILDKFMNEFTEIMNMEINSILHGIINLFAISIVLVMVIFMIAKLGIQLVKVREQENLYKDYKEIIDEMIKNERDT